jgi:hypothetical protein
MMSGRPTRPVVHWLSRPGGGWTEVEEVEADPGDTTEEDATRDEPPRRLGFARRSARAPTLTR